MKYLKTHVGTVAANYEAAYQLVKRRHENTRLILSKFLDNQLDQPATQMENADKSKATLGHYYGIFTSNNQFGR